MTNPFSQPNTMLTDATKAMNPAPPPTMPDPMSPDALAARRRTEEDVMGRAGRMSTILSSAMNRAPGAGGAGGSTGRTPAAATAPVAGGVYSSNKLGSSA